MDWWQRLTVTAWLLLDQHGLLAAFLFLLVEEAGTPIPLPGDFLMVLIGARAAEGRLVLVQVLIAMELATVIGASCLYWLSARAGRRVVYRLGRHVGLTAARLDRAGEELNRRGAMAVILGRLTPGFRIVTPMVCGLFRFPFHVFLPAMALGAFAYILVYTLLGFFFGPHVLRLLETFELPLGLLASGALLALLVYWTVRVGQRARPAERSPELRERLWAGAASGLIATLQSALLANVLIHMLGLAAFHAPGVALSRLILLLSAEVVRAPGAAAASLLFPALSIVGVLLGAAYGAWIGRKAHGGGPLYGAAFGLLPLGLSLLVVLPLLGAGPAGLQLGAGPVPAAGETIRHLSFGLVLGTIYPALARPRGPRPARLAADAPEADVETIPTRI
jgi:membrane protein DedA with SNARE-associated domain